MYLLKDDNFHRSQNNGIIINQNQDNELINFFGILTDIIELKYGKDNREALFKCEWFDLNHKKHMHTKR